MRLLIVDDEEKFLRTISERLKLKGFDVTTALDGKSAVKSAKKARFDLVLLDLRLPDMEGSQVLKQLKKKHKFLEVVMLTGYASLESAVECTKLGAYGYLEKSSDFEAIIRTLQEAYEARLKKKFEHDKKRMEEIEVLSMGSSPMAIIRSLIRLDDDEK
jgi:DNA-binding NtrC family response regulator